MASPSSDYYQGNPAASPNVTVYPPPAQSNGELSNPPKKRRREDGVNGETSSLEAAAPGPGGAVYPQLVHTNEHIRMIQLRNKAEFEDMIDLCVS